MEIQRLLSVVEARERLLGDVEVLESEHVNTESALGRVLAEDIMAVNDAPPFANSSMDGYAVRAADVSKASLDSPVILPVKADIPAGSGLCLLYTSDAADE